jgi:hypothetical protein
MDINRKETEKRFTALDQQNVNLNTQQSEALEHVRQRIDNIQEQINTRNTILDQISNTLRLDWLRQLGSELKGLMRRTVALNVATYHAIISIQAALPSRLERALIEEPFILEDPIGRIAPVHLQFVTCWDAFHAVMEHRFLNLQGFKKIQQRKYGLQDRASKREIKQTLPWERAFLPGQRVEMAIDFRIDKAKDSNGASMACPGCHTLSDHAGDTDAQCQNCLIWYRRITVLQKDEPNSWDSLLKSGQADHRGLSGLVPPGRKRTAQDEEGEEDISKFKRVRIMRTEKLLTWPVRRNQFTGRTSRVSKPYFSPSVELCVGCNDTWKRPIPDMDQGPLAPAENNADYMRLASDMIDRLRDQRNKADASYEQWKEHHSHCQRLDVISLERPEEMLHPVQYYHHGDYYKRRSEVDAGNSQNV